LPNFNLLAPCSGIAAYFVQSPQFHNNKLLRLL
jgi:hypothetical protein